MLTEIDQSHRGRLRRIAFHAMHARGLETEFPSPALAELARISGPATMVSQTIRVLNNRIWCSIDNDDSRDLDQLTSAESLPDGRVRILVAIADVDALVSIHGQLDSHAQHNTTSIYTAAVTFPMLPERLSTNLTSLNLDADRLALVVEMTIETDGAVGESDVYPALVRNRARLAYHAVADWLNGQIPLIAHVSRVADLESNLRLQDQVAQSMRMLRRREGALDLETSEVRPVFTGDVLGALLVETPNRAKSIIEEFMIAANEVTVRYLMAHRSPTLRRVVRIPESWARIVVLAGRLGFSLPAEADARALASFLLAQKSAEPLAFPDLSLSVIKLLGRGEYVAQIPGADAPGHFALAVGDYTHATAPNRRFPDLISQRLVKAVWAGHPSPYDDSELTALASHCTKAEDAAKKIERLVGKSAAALVIEHRIGERFSAIVTGASAKGTWVRSMQPPVEGRLVEGFVGLEVGQRVQVELVRVDVDQGFIDFRRVP